MNAKENKKRHKEKGEYLPKSNARKKHKDYLTACRTNFQLEPLFTAGRQDIEKALIFHILDRSVETLGL